MKMNIKVRQDKKSVKKAYQLKLDLKGTDQQLRHT